MKIINKNFNRKRFERLLNSLFYLIKHKYQENEISRNDINDILISLNQEFVDSINFTTFERYIYDANYNLKDNILFCYDNEFLLNSITYFLLIKLVLIGIPEAVYILKTEIKNVIILLKQNNDIRSIGVKQWEILQDLFYKLSLEDRKKLMEIYRNNRIITNVFQDFQTKVKPLSKDKLQKYSNFIRDDMKKCSSSRSQFLFIDDYDRWICPRCGYEVFRRKSKKGIFNRMF